MNVWSCWKIASTLIQILRYVWNANLDIIYQTTCAAKQAKLISKEVAKILIVVSMFKIVPNLSTMCVWNAKQIITTSTIIVANTMRHITQKHNHAKSTILTIAWFTKTKNNAKNAKTIMHWLHLKIDLGCALRLMITKIVLNSSLAKMVIKTL